MDLSCQACYSQQDSFLDTMGEAVVRVYDSPGYVNNLFIDGVPPDIDYLSTKFCEKEMCWPVAQKRIHLLTQDV
jgi:hypothetical protein